MRRLLLLLALAIFSSRIRAQSTSSTTAAEVSSDSTSSLGAVSTSDTSNPSVSEGSTTPPVVPSGQTTTLAGTVGTGSTISSVVPSGQTTLPAETGTTQKPTEPAIGLNTFVMASMGPNPVDDKSILQEAANLNAQVLSLIQQVNTLQKEVDPNNSSYFTELQQIQANATIANNTLTQLVKNLTNAQGMYQYLMQNYTGIAGYYTCFANAPCVTASPTTPEPTTTPVPAPCSTDTPAEATTDPKVYHLDPTSTINCDTYISGENNEIVLLTVTKLEMNGTAFLQIYDSSNNNLIKNYTTNITNGNDEINTTSSRVRISYRTVWNSYIGFDISYRAANPCDGFFCNQPKGKCELSHSGQPYCVCIDPCIQNDGEIPCNKTVNPCSTLAKRACAAGDDLGVCEEDKSIVDICTFKCNCINGTTDPDNSKTCLPPGVTFSTSTPGILTNTMSIAASLSTQNSPETSTPASSSDSTQPSGTASTGLSTGKETILTTEISSTDSNTISTSTTDLSTGS